MYNAMWTQEIRNLFRHFFWKGSTLKKKIFFSSVLLNSWSNRIKVGKKRDLKDRRNYFSQINSQHDGDKDTLLWKEIESI